MIDDRRARGLYLCSSGDALQGAPPELMLVEAMAQVGGALAFGTSGEPGFLTALDDVRIDHVPAPGDRIEIDVTIDASLGGLHRLRGSAKRDGVEVARARFVLGVPSRPE